MSNRKENEVRGWYLNELLHIMKRVFYSVIQIDLLENTVYVLQSTDRPEWVEKKCSWTEYLDNYSRFIPGDSLECFQAERLLEEYRSGQMIVTKDVQYSIDKYSGWLTIDLFIEEIDGRPYASATVKKSSDEHLQKSIIAQYVYSKCDHFACLDVRNDSFETFGGSVEGILATRKKYDNYSNEVMKFVKKYVVPEERVKVLHRMSLNCIREQLEYKDTHIFNYGMIDPVRGYARKQLEYHYYDRNTQMILVACTDVTEWYVNSKKKENELLKALRRASTDSLTGILNHQGTVDEVSFHLGEDNGNSAIMFVDMDDFKSVNDSLGHGVGDKLLKRVAEILRKGVRSDDLVGRIGGDEFLVFLRNVGTVEEAGECAQRLCRDIKRLSIEFSFPIGCSIGIAFSPDDGMDYYTLTECADKRVYHAKSRGKNQIALD